MSKIKEILELSSTATGTEQEAPNITETIERKALKSAVVFITTAFSELGQPTEDVPDDKIREVLLSAWIQYHSKVAGTRLDLIRNHKAPSNQLFLRCFYILSPTATLKDFLNFFKKNQGDESDLPHIDNLFTVETGMEMTIKTSHLQLDTCWVGEDTIQAGGKVNLDPYLKQHTPSGQTFEELLGEDPSSSNSGDTIPSNYLREWVDEMVDNNNIISLIECYNRESDSNKKKLASIFREMKPFKTLASDPRESLSKLSDDEQKNLLFDFFHHDLDMPWWRHIKDKENVPHHFTRETIISEVAAYLSSIKLKEFLKDILADSPPHSIPDSIPIAASDRYFLDIRKLFETLNPQQLTAALEVINSKESNRNKSLLEGRLNDRRFHAVDLFRHRPLENCKAIFDFLKKEKMLASLYNHSINNRFAFIKYLLPEQVSTFLEAIYEDKEKWDELITNSPDGIVNLFSNIAAVEHKEQRNAAFTFFNDRDLWPTVINNRHQLEVVAYLPADADGIANVFNTLKQSDKQPELISCLKALTIDRCPGLDFGNSSKEEIEEHITTLEAKEDIDDNAARSLLETITQTRTFWQDHIYGRRFIFLDTLQRHVTKNYDKYLYTIYVMPTMWQKLIIDRLDLIFLNFKEDDQKKIIQFFTDNNEWQASLNNATRLLAILMATKYEEIKTLIFETINNTSGFWKNIKDKFIVANLYHYLTPEQQKSMAREVFKHSNDGYFHKKHTRDYLIERSLRCFEEEIERNEFFKEYVYNVIKQHGDKDPILTNLSNLAGVLTLLSVDNRNCLFTHLNSIEGYWKTFEFVNHTLIYNLLITLPANHQETFCNELKALDISNKAETFYMLLNQCSQNEAMWKMICNALITQYFFTDIKSFQKFGRVKSKIRDYIFTQLNSIEYFWTKHLNIETQQNLEDVSSVLSKDQMKIVCEQLLSNRQTLNKFEKMLVDIDNESAKARNGNGTRILFETAVAARENNPSCFSGHPTIDKHVSMFVRNTASNRWPAFFRNPLAWLYSTPANQPNDNTMRLS